MEAFLAETRPVDLDAEPLFPEEPLEPLAEPRWEGPLETAPPDLLLAARPRRAEASAEEPTAEPADEPASEQAQAAAPESAPTAAEPRGLEVESSAPVEVPGACEPPSYPEALSRRGLEARVRLAITVAPDGHVNGVEILEWSGHRPLVERAAQAVLTWRYTPGRRDGEAVEWVVEKTIVFDPGSNR